MMRTLTPFLLRLGLCVCIGAIIGITVFAADPAETSNENPSVDQATIESINSFNHEQSQIINPTPKPCDDCPVKIDHINVHPYEQCTSKNKYLQSALGNFKNNPVMSAILSMPDSQDIVRSECIQASMKNYTAGQAYHLCQPDQSAAYHFIRRGKKRVLQFLTPKVPKACVSKENVDVTAKSFNAVAQCLSGYVSHPQDLSPAENQNINSLSIFAMINVESGFNSNAMSPTGAGGVGQFTQTAIDAVNNNMTAIKDYLSQSTNPVCKDALTKALTPPMSSGPSHSCERIKLSDNNPLRNLIYTFAYQALIRRDLDGVYANYQDIFSNLAPNRREAILAVMMTWAHNTGVAGMHTPLIKLLDHMQRNHEQITSFDTFITDLRTYMKRFPNKENNNPGRIKETSSYYPSFVKNMRKNVLNEIGKERPRACLANQSAQ